MSPVCWISPAITTPGPSLRSTSRLDPSPIIFEGDFLDVEDDVRDVLTNAGDRREFVQHAVDLHRRHRRALQRRQQDAPQRIAERHAEPALEGLGHQRRNPPALAPLLNLKLVWPNELLPVLLVHVHVHGSVDYRRC